MDKPTLPMLNRRTAVAGAGVIGAVGALAGVATAVPGAPAPALVKAAEAQTDHGRYQLSDHVKHYYATARI